MFLWAVSLSKNTHQLTRQDVSCRQVWLGAGFLRLEYNASKVTTTSLVIVLYCCVGWRVIVLFSLSFLLLLFFLLMNGMGQWVMYSSLAGINYGWIWLDWVTLNIMRWWYYGWLASLWWWSLLYCKIFAYLSCRDHLFKKNERWKCLCFSIWYLPTRESTCLPFSGFMRSTMPLQPLMLVHHKQHLWTMMPKPKVTIHLLKTNCVKLFYKFFHQIQSFL